MAKVAFILLCHKDPGSIIRQAQSLTEVGDCIAIHFDASANKDDYSRIREELKDNPRVAFAKKRFRCGWGEWSLIQATLQAMIAAEDAFPDATHFYMVSGDCMPIKSAKYTHNFLDASDLDYVECFDFLSSDWIKTGMKEDRLVYRHFFNEREQKWRFYTSLNLQRRFGLRREIPSDLQVMIGSQWWVLRRKTVEAILEFCQQRTDITRFFSTTWIPDETFFQTLVKHLVPEKEIRSRTLTFLIFSDYGMPVNFYNDQYDLLLAQDYLFARKISPEARELKQRLNELYTSEKEDFDVSNEGANLFHFMSSRGRIGLRYGQRFWEQGATLGRDRELLIVMCKKWHVAKRLVETVRKVSDIPVLSYLFNELDTDLPELGGISSTLQKRTRHRRALMRLIFENMDTDKLIICLDPVDFALLQDFYSDKCKTRLLEIATDFSDDYLVGHAKRVGLAGENTPSDTIDRLLPTIRNSVQTERDQIRDAEFPLHFIIRENATEEENAKQIAIFLDLSEEEAREVARTPYLFAD